MLPVICAIVEKNTNSSKTFNRNRSYPMPNKFHYFHTDKLSFVLGEAVFSCSDSFKSGFCGSGTFLNLR